MSGAAIENVTFDLLAVFQSECDISAKIERLLEGGTDFFPAGQLRNPAFQIFALAPGRMFKFVGIGAALRNAHDWGISLLFGQSKHWRLGAATNAILLPEPEPRAARQLLIVSSICSGDVAGGSR